jgi:ArsR family transcriptional regulator, arsenate/arsenite/antimonite-responsive transcriptional repressor / arsenate reductase (thioredoxin)
VVADPSTATPDVPDVAPPEFLRLAGHPLRWQLLAELARSDRRVAELTALVGQPQNAVSYHLAQLRAGGLVSARRSSADARDTYYRIELDRCTQLLAATGAALHPGLRASISAQLATSPGAPMPAGRRPRPVRVLFLCTGNSARSQIAEALLNGAGEGRVEALSAGSQPKPIHPDALRVLREYGIDPDGQRSKHLEQFTRRRFDYVITLCDKVREICPEFAGRPAPIHWSIPDPAAGGYDAFCDVAAQLDARIRYFTHALDSVNGGVTP